MHATSVCEDISKFDRPAVPVYGCNATIGRSEFRGRVKFGQFNVITPWSRTLLTNGGEENKLGAVTTSE